MPTKTDIKSRCPTFRLKAHRQRLLLFSGVRNDVIPIKSEYLPASAGGEDYMIFARPPPPRTPWRIVIQPVSHSKCTVRKRSITSGWTAKLYDETRRLPTGLTVTSCEIHTVKITCHDCRSPHVSRVVPWSNILESWMFCSSLRSSNRYRPRRRDTGRIVVNTSSSMLLPQAVSAEHTWLQLKVKIFCHSAPHFMLFLLRHACPHHFQHLKACLRTTVTIAGTRNRIRSSLV